MNQKPNGIILIDTPRNGWSHLVSDSIENLHNFAALLGVNKCWFENKRGKFRPHYDLNEKHFDKAITLGAELVSSKTIVEFLKLHYEKGI